MRDFNHIIKQKGYYEADENDYYRILSGINLGNYVPKYDQNLNPAPSIVIPDNRLYNGGTLPTLEVTYDTPRTLIERVDEQKR